MRILALFENMLELKRVLKAVKTLRLREHIFFLDASRLITFSFNLFHNSFLHMFFVSNYASLLVVIIIRKENTILLICL